MYPAPSSPWSVHPDTNSHPKLETGTPPCSGPPLPASLPPCFPSSRVSRAGPSSVGMSQGCGECGTAPLSCGNATAPLSCSHQGLPGASWALQGRPWIAPALCALGFSCGFQPRAGLGWVWFPGGFWLALPRVPCPDLPEGSPSTVSLQLPPRQAGICDLGKGSSACAQ